MTTAKRGGKRPKAGRPALGKVKLTCWVKPETRAKLGEKPGQKIDETFSDQSRHLDDETEAAMERLRKASAEAVCAAWKKSKLNPTNKTAPA